MEARLSFTGAATDDEVLAAVVRHMKADSGTIHLIGKDGMLHLAAATPGFPEVVLKTIAVIPPGVGRSIFPYSHYAFWRECPTRVGFASDRGPGSGAPCPPLDGCEDDGHLPKLPLASAVGTRRVGGGHCEWTGRN